MPDGDRTPSPVTLTAFHLLRQGLGAEEVSGRTGLPLALVELIATEDAVRLGRGVSGPHRSPVHRRRDRVIATAIATLAVTSLIGALASAMLHNPRLGITSGGCAAVSLLAVHLHTRSRRPTR